MFVLPGRTDAGGAEEGFAGGQFVAGWRQQGYLGVFVRGAKSRVQRARRQNSFSLLRALCSLLDFMLSRVADSIYWMSRYVERAENVARFISVNLNLSLDMPGEAGQQWWPLVVITGDDKPYQARITETTKESVVQFLTFDAENPNSILSCLHWRHRIHPAIPAFPGHQMSAEQNRSLRWSACDTSSPFHAYPTGIAACTPVHL